MAPKSVFTAYSASATPRRGRVVSSASATCRPGLMASPARRAPRPTAAPSAGRSRSTAALSSRLYCTCREPRSRQPTALTAPHRRTEVPHHQPAVCSQAASHALTGDDGQQCRNGWRDRQDRWHQWRHRLCKDRRLDESPPRLVGGNTGRGTPRDRTAEPTNPPSDPALRSNRPFTA